MPVHQLHVQGKCSLTIYVIPKVITLKNHPKTTSTNRMNSKANLTMTLPLVK